MYSICAKTYLHRESQQNLRRAYHSNSYKVGGDGCDDEEKTPRVCESSTTILHQKLLNKFIKSCLPILKRHEQSQYIKHRLCTCKNKASGKIKRSKKKRTQNEKRQQQPKLMKYTWENHQFPVRMLGQSECWLRFATWQIIGLHRTNIKWHIGLKEERKKL